MNRNNLLITAVLVSTLLAACATDEQLSALPDAGNEVHLSATLQEMKVASRTGETATPIVPSEVAPYYLYYEISNIQSNQPEVPKAFKASFGTSSGVYWDEVAPAATLAETSFQLTNVPNGKVYPSETNKDIQWGVTAGWQAPLAFELTHRMAQLTLIVIDQTNNGAGSVESTNPIYKDVKVVLSTLSKEAKSFDLKTGIVTATDREKEVELYPNTQTVTGETLADKGGIKYTSTAVLFPPQEFTKADTKRDSLRITCGKYTYTVEMPKNLTLPVADVTTALKAGEHLTLTILLKEDAVGLTATLADWKEITADEMPLNRVFNIASLEELKDFALAVNTGYDFKGMIVRIKKEIDFVVGSKLTAFSIGTKNHPFRGIFDGNGQTMKQLGAAGDGNSYTGSLFGYTEGATLRNMKFETPYVTGQGALVAEAKNTVIIGCEMMNGAVTGTGSDVGALVGKATGTTTLTNCYVTGTVVSANGKGNVGGLVGSTEGSITHCFATGSVTGGNNVGGLAGKVNGSVLNCYAWGSVSGISNIGGLVGTTQGSVNNSYAAGEVKLTTGSSADRGGLLGSIGFGGIVKSCAWNKAALNAGSEDTNGAGVVKLSSENNCASFDFASGGDTLLEKLNSGNPGTGIWKSGSNNKPIFN